MAHWAMELFGDQLLTKDGTKATKDAVNGKKAVLVYFSAHWFTPILAQAYKTYSGGDVEVIFISSDRDQGSFDRNFAQMPWTALPLADRGRKEKLSRQFGVRGIPRLVVLNGDDGSLVERNGRGEVQLTKDLGKSLVAWIGNSSTQPAANASPEVAAHWAANLFGQFIVTKSGKKETAQVVANKKFVLVYFSAHWCPPCHDDDGFTPILAEAYKKYDKGDIEIVFVSSDLDQASCDWYFAEMPWTAVPFEDREQKEKLSKQFNVQGIPTLVVLNASDGKLVTEEGRRAVQFLKDLGKCSACWGRAGTDKKGSCCIIS